MKKDNPGDFSSYVVETPFMQKERIKETQQLVEDMNKLLAALIFTQKILCNSEDEYERSSEVISAALDYTQKAIEMHEAKYGV